MSLGTRRSTLLGIAVLTLALLPSCNNPKTSVTQVWKAPWRPPSMKTMIVFATRLDEANRRTFEDGAVAVLARHDVKARQSYVLFPGTPPDRDVARQLVQDQGFDGILVASLRDVRERQTYVPGTYQGGFWGSYYNQGWGAWSSGYVVTDEIVSFETTLWDTRAEDRLVWTALTETTNPSAGPKFVQSVTGAIEQSLVRTGIIPPAREQK